jgi:hypothetical protein
LSIPASYQHEGYPGRPIQAGPLRVPPAMQMYLGCSIDRICRNAIVHEHGQNHCAHFVCHVMGYNHLPGAVKCTVRDVHTPGTNGVHIRVNEVYNVAPNRWMWPANGRLQEPCLVVATTAENVHNQQPPTIGMGRRKHIGLYTGGSIWHYLTSHSRVYADTPQGWRRRMELAYGGNGHHVVLFMSSGLLHV